MIVSTTRQFVFIHIFKTAGTSVKRAIRRYAMPGWQEHANSVLKRIGIPQFGPPSLGDHKTASQLISEIEMREFRRLFSFAFVRNPWDWELSHYRYILRQRGHDSFEEVSALGEFSEYVRWRCDGRFKSQESFLLHEGKPVVDFVGRFENLESDFQFVCRKLGIESRLPLLNHSAQKSWRGLLGINDAANKASEAEEQAPTYRAKYNEITQQLIQETYASDIERFGYAF